MSYRKDMISHAEQIHYKDPRSISELSMLLVSTNWTITYINLYGMPSFMKQ